MEQVIIFGAYRGIGLALANKYVSEGHQVTTVNRTNSNTLSHLPTIDYFDIDMRDENSLKHLADTLGEQKLDCLFHNAGIWSDEEMLSDNMDFSKLSEVFEVNSIAPLKVVNTFRSLLSK